MTAVVTGTATDYDDLLDTVVSVLTTNADLVANNEQWVLEKDDSTAVTNERHVYLRGPGLSQSDNIYVNLRQYFNATLQNYNWEIRYATGFDTNEPLDNQIGTSVVTLTGERGGPRFTLANQSMGYWIIANGRRFIVVAKISSVYVSMYAGFITPYALPAEFDYPMYIAGSSCFENAVWSLGTNELSSPWDPNGVGNSTVDSARLRHYDGTRIDFNNFTRSTGSRNNSTSAVTWPYAWAQRANTSQINKNEVFDQNPDGSYTLLPVILETDQNDGQVYGELDGIFFIPGLGPNASEDTISIGGDNYLVVQSVHRTGPFDYAAIRLT